MDNKSYKVQLSELSELIDISMYTGDYNEVIKVCDRFLILKPNDKLAYLNKGLAYWKIGKYNESILCYDEAIHQDKNYFKAYFNRGVSYMYKSSHYNNIREDSLKIKFANCAIDDFNHFINNCYDNKDKALALTNRAQVYMILKAGDYVALLDAGAYGYSMAGNYNSRPLIAQIMVDKDKHYIIRKEQSFEDMIKNELS